MDHNQHSIVFAVAAAAGTALGQSCDPALVGQTDTPASDYAVAVDGHHAFVCDRSGNVAIRHGLVVLDIADPAAPAQIARIELPDDPWDLVVQAGLAYIAAGQDGLVVVDVSDPALPVIVSSEGGPANAQGVDLAGRYAYIAGGRNDGLWIYDIADPADPVVTAYLQLPQHSYKVRVRDGLAYVAALGAGLQIVDVGNPFAPFVVGSFDPEQFVYDVAVYDTTAVLACEFPAVYTVDISDPASPAEIAQHRFEDDRPAYGVTSRGPVAVVGTQYGVHVLDLADPGVPSEAGMYSLPYGSAHRATLDGDLAYVPVRGAGPIVLDLAGCFGGAQPCTPADFAQPYGSLDMNDVNAFIDAFVVSGPQADLDGNGILDLRDVIEFIQSFVAGCPS